eukprot:6474147-Amphidinium_carterae.2
MLSSRIKSYWVVLRLACCGGAAQDAVDTWHEAGSQLHTSGLWSDVRRAWLRQLACFCFVCVFAFLGARRDFNKLTSDLT